MSVGHQPYLPGKGPVHLNIEDHVGGAKAISWLYIPGSHLPLIHTINLFESYADIPHLLLYRFSPMISPRLSIDSIGFRNRLENLDSKFVSVFPVLALDLADYPLLTPQCLLDPLFESGLVIDTVSNCILRELNRIRFFDEG